MKKFIFTFLLVFSIFCGGVASGFLPTKSWQTCAQSTNPANYNTATISDENEAAKTIFMVNPTCIASTADKTYVYDLSDNCLKLITTDVASRKSYKLPDLGNIKDMCAIGDDIYLLTDKANYNLCKVSIDNNDELSVQAISLNYGVTNRDKINCGIVDGKPVIIIFSSVYKSSEADTHPIYAMQTNGQFTFSLLNLVGDEMVQLSEVPFNDIVITGNSTNAWAIISSYTQSVGTVALSMTSGTLDDIQSGDYKPDLLDGSLQLTNIKQLSIVDNQDGSTAPMLYVAGSSGISLYQLNTSGTSIASSKINSNSYNFTDQIKDFSVMGQNPCILVDNGYYMLNSDNLFVAVVNPTCIVTQRDAENFMYYQLTKQTKLIESPSSSTQSYLLDSDAFVVEIADITLQDNGNVLGGYKYVLSYVKTEDGNYVNQYGYIEIEDNILLLEQTAASGVLKVADGTYLYSMPSDALDQTNSKYTIDGRMPVQVLMQISQYNTTSTNAMGEELTVYYALVKVGTLVGFINQSMEIPPDKLTPLVIPNAKLTHDATVWLEADSSSMVMHNLEAGTKVRIIGSRDKNGYIQVRYNDQYGNEFEGYILATRVQSYSYTTLQIIGSILVALNVVFLVVLVVTKRRIAK